MSRSFTRQPVPPLNWTGLVLSAVMGGALGLALVTAVVVAAWMV